jgi:hypothetical protein
MTKLIFIFALGAAALLVSCEPLPVYPQDPYGRAQRGTNHYERYDNRYDQARTQDPRTQNLAPAPAPRQEYPVAERTDNPRQVISPYEPYNVIDVEGFRSGQLAKDPSNGKIFRIP